MNQRIGNDMGDIGTPGDNKIPAEASENTWEGIATTNHSWGYKSYGRRLEITPGDPVLAT